MALVESSPGVLMGGSLERLEVPYQATKVFPVLSISP